MPAVRSSGGSARSPPHGESGDSSRPSDVASVSSAARLGMNNSVQLRFSPGRSPAKSLRISRTWSSSRACSIRANSSRLPANSCKNVGGVGTSSSATDSRAPGRCAARRVDVRAAHDVGRLLGGRLLEVAPGRGRADRLVHEQVDQGQSRAVLEHQEDRAGEPAGQPHRPGRDQGIRRAQQVGRPIQLEQVDLADRQPDLGAQPFRKRRRRGLAPGRRSSATIDTGRPSGWVAWVLTSDYRLYVQDSRFTKILMEWEPGIRCWALHHSRRRAGCRATMSITASRSRISETRPSPRMLAPDSPGMDR